jgi:IS5 family transposase
LKIRKGVIQDATFITADSGHASADTPRLDEAKTRRNKEGTWTKKGTKSYFGLKLHTKEDCDFGLIRSLQITTASVHDCQIDLSQKGEVVYRDRGYFGAEPKGFDTTMQRGVRGGIRSVSGIFSEINGFQENDLPGRDPMLSSRMFSIMLIPT